LPRIELPFFRPKKREAHGVNREPRAIFARSA
jgi:hypothetical protein